jgi:NAD(P)H-flavin reductase
MKTKTAVKIVSNTEISKGIYRLALAGVTGGGLSDIADTAVPGQFVNIYLNSKTMLLPRPFGISDIETSMGIEIDADIEVRADGETHSADNRTRIVLVYAVVGAGTAELSSYTPGTRIQLLGPQGNGYDLDELGRHILLIGGGLGIPPLLFAARRIRESALPGDRMKITALLGYRDVPYYADDFEKYCDDVFCISQNAPRRGERNDEPSYIDVQGTASGFAPHSHGGVVVSIPSNSVRITNPSPCDGVAASILSNSVRTANPHPRGRVATGINGTVMDLIASLIAGGRLDLNDTSILSCGPTPMLKAVAEWAFKHSIPAQVSLEERMGCGYGACVGCTVEIKNEDAAFLHPVPVDAVPGETGPAQSGAVPGSTDPVQTDTDSVSAMIRKKICKDGPVFSAESVIWQ